MKANVLKQIKDRVIAAGDRLGRIMTMVLLSIFYATVVAFIWVIAKIFRKHFLDMRYGEKTDSYWIPVESDFNDHTPEKLSSPFL